MANSPKNPENWSKPETLCDQANCTTPTKGKTLDSGPQSLDQQAEIWASALLQSKTK